MRWPIPDTEIKNKNVNINEENIWIRRNTRTLYKNNRIVSEINSILFET